MLAVIRQPLGKERSFRWCVYSDFKLTPIRLPPPMTTTIMATFSIHLKQHYFQFSTLRFLFSFSYSKRFAWWSKRRTNIFSLFFFFFSFRLLLHWKDFFPTQTRNYQHRPPLTTFDQGLLREDLSKHQYSLSPRVIRKCLPVTKGMAEILITIESKCSKEIVAHFFSVTQSF